MEMVDRLTAWTYERQRLAKPARTAADALAAVVAVYATHPTCPLALWARTRSLTPTAYRRIDGGRKALRIPAMRKTLFLVPRDRAALVFTAVRLKPEHALRPLKRHDLSLKEYDEIAGRLLDAAREPVQSNELQDAAGVSGPPLGTILRCLRYQGRLLALAGPSLMMSAHRYVATTSWAPDGLDAGDPSGAREWLARTYLRAYGPARVEDFAWWTGVTKKAAARAIESLDCVDVGDGLLLQRRDLAAFERVEKVCGTVDLLPKWDAYTMGLAPDGRQRFVDPDIQHLVYTPIGPGLPGDGNPVVLVDGRVAGIWTYTLKDGARVQPFGSYGPKVKQRVDAKLEEVAALLSQ